VIKARVVPRLLAHIGFESPWIDIFHRILVDWAWQIPIDSDFLASLASFWSADTHPDYIQLDILLKTIDSCPDPQLLIASDLLPSLMVFAKGYETKNNSNALCLLKIASDPRLGDVFSHLVSEAGRSLVLSAFTL
jgi:hypothetical protein